MIRVNTYTQNHQHIIFAPRFRAALIRPEWKDRFLQYTTGIIQQQHHKLLQINSMPDHVHILVGMRTTQCIADLVQNVKTETSKWFKTLQTRRDQPFAWQEGYGSFARSKSHVPDLIAYIRDQERHHQAQTFLDEYRTILTEEGIAWDEQYIFNVPE